MTDVFFLDWTIIAVSFFNTILMLWLGLTVLLAAERRRLGVWLLGGGLLVSAGFFIVHTAILGHGLARLDDGLDIWWQLGWFPVIASPFAWYGMVLWYAGFWNATAGDTLLRQRHRTWFIVTSVLGAGLLTLMLFAHPLPSFTQITFLDLSTTLSIAGVPVVFIIYPIFMLLCIVLSIDALRHPAPSERMMGDLARRRTRPWLMAAALILLAVSLLATGFLIEVVRTSRTGAPILRLPGIFTSVAWIDLTISSLIAVAVLLLGQAIVSYEVFTGKTLPRRGFFQHWRSLVLLALGFSILVGWTLAGRLQPIYGLLLATLLMVAFYALYSWRSFAERDRLMIRLRPFVGSQQLTAHLIDQTDDTREKATRIFQALCDDVLNVREAQLHPMGAVASLAGPPLLLPRTGSSSVDVAPALFGGPSNRFVALDTSRDSDLQWAIPLWTERGLLGALLLGDKRDGGLFTQEEVEIARASGERLIDMLAGEAIAQRLMALQRRRLAETQILDHSTRRRLHDEVLPDLHTAIVQLGGHEHDAAAVADAVSTLSDVHGQISDLIRVRAGIDTETASREGLIMTLQKSIASEFAGIFDGIRWNVPDDEPHLAPLGREVVFYAVREAVRNAALHGRGIDARRLLHLEIEVDYSDGLTITVRDDGIGSDTPVLNDEAAGDNTSEGGLALHATMIAILGGRLTVESTPRIGTKVVITIPIGNHQSPDSVAQQSRLNQSDVLQEMGAF